MSEPVASDGRRRQRRLRPFRLSWVVLLLATIAIVGGVLYLTFFSGTDVVYVAAADLPAYHQIEQRDVRGKTMDRRDVPDDAIRDRATILGRYTLSSVRQDQPFDAQTLGPQLPASTLRSPIVALPYNPETALGGRLARGDLVDILMSPNEAGGSPQRIKAVVVLDIIEGSAQSIVVMMNDDFGIDTLMRSRGSATIVSVRVAPYSVG